MTIKLKKQLIDFFAVTLVILFSLFSLLFSEKITDIPVSKYLIYSEKNGIIFNIGNSLVHLDSNGRFKEQIDFKTLGIQAIGDITYIDNSVLLIDSTQGFVYKCQRDPFKKCQKLFSTPYNGLDEREVNIAVNERDKVLYIAKKDKSFSADTYIHKYTIEGKFLYSLYIPKLASSINSLHVDSKGNLMLADTENSRIVILDDKGAYNSEIIWTYSTKTEVQTGKRMYPTSFSKNLTNDNLWIINKDQYYYKKDILVLNSLTQETLFDSEQGYKNDYFHYFHRLEYDDFDKVVAYNDGVLYLDSRQFALAYIDASLNIDKDFLDENVKVLFEKLYKRKEVLVGWFYLSVILTLISLVGVIFLYYVEKKKVNESVVRIFFNSPLPYIFLVLIWAVIYELFQPLY